MTTEVTQKSIQDLAALTGDPAVLLTAPVDEVPAEQRSVAIALRFIAQYDSKNTRAAYERDLRDWFEWCGAHDVDVLAVRRTHVNLYALDLGEDGRGLARSTVARRLSTLAGYYKTAVMEEAIEVSPVALVRRPKVSDETQTLGLDKEEAKAVLRVARADGPRTAALVTLLVHDGLRISQALGIDIEDLLVVRGQRVARVRRKGNGRRDVALNAVTWQAVSDYIDGRESGPLFVTGSGKRLDRHAAAKIVRRIARRAGVENADRISPHSARHTFVTLSLEAGVPLERVQDAADHADPRTTQRYNRDRHRLEKHPAHVLGAVLAGDEEGGEG